MPAAAEPKKLSALASLGFGGASAVATVNFTHPIETVKTRIQVLGASYSIAGHVRTEGVASLWKGIQPAWAREAMYASIKIGGYAPIRDAIGAGEKGASVGLKFLAGALSGSIGSAVGNPMDVMKTMMQANEGKSVPLRTLMGTMMAEQGVGGFYRGVEVNMMRACVLNGTKMLCYDTCKGLVTKSTGWSRKDIKNQFTSSVVAGFFMTIAVAPFDMIRTKLMNQPTDKKIYAGFVDCCLKTVKADGPLALYRGFLPIWGRFAPSATLQLVIYETLLTNGGYNAI